MSWWPFRDEQAFWVWAMDPFAELDSQDEDLLLYDVAGFDLLIAAAGWADCPKRDLCLIVLEDYSRLLAWQRRPDDLAALRAAAQRASRQVHPLVNRWAAYALRLLAHVEREGQVNRESAVSMATDLLATPTTQGRVELNLATVQKGRLWECSHRLESRHLYINRRTGAWQIYPPQAATPALLSAL
ncbi:hypothetical protein M1L60_46320 [Actinoplanes sp. TRM 88003]|uniref:DUF2285 domain-containing protein n=1 Tax=Paractinoplanes aksuensis TaxID=2939490 RepID=A0ABT1E4E9_9ACTN|nr:hypothetical protein [Actinoplanes aksuensis]MCO8278012.1 hypothetical protein [Actinoplanes aksuensis]